MEGIDNSIAGNVDVAVGILLLQVLLGEWGWREVVSGDASGNLTVHLLWPWAVDVVGAEASLYVTDRDLCVESGKGCCGRGGGVAMNEDYIGGALLEDIAHTSEDAGSYIGEVLTLFHDVEVDIGCYLKDSEYLIEHLAMLSGDAHDGFKLFGALLELFNQWTHFDGFGTGSED